MGINGEGGNRHLLPGLTPGPGRLMNREEKAAALLACPAGAALILDISANLADHSLMYLAQPRVSFKMAALAVGFVDQHGDAGLREAALREAQSQGHLARRIADNPASDWWWEPFDPENQTWESPQFPRGRERDPLQLFRPEEWAHPEPPGEHEDGLPHGDAAPSHVRITRRNNLGVDSLRRRYMRTHLPVPPGRMASAIQDGTTGMGGSQSMRLAPTLPRVSPPRPRRQVGAGLASSISGVGRSAFRAGCSADGGPSAVRRGKRVVPDVALPF